MMTTLPSLQESQMVKFCAFPCLLGGWTVHVHWMTGEDIWLRAASLMGALEMVPEHAIWGEARS